MVTLRDVLDSDLPLFYKYQRNERAIEMTSYPPRDLQAFQAHWDKIQANTAIIIQTILFNEQVAGHILCFEVNGEKEIGYWLGGDFWGKGVATEALRQFLKIITVRPLNAHIAQQNIGSRKVLEKCDFIVVGEGKWIPPTGTEEVDEYALQLE